MTWAKFRETFKREFMVANILYVKAQDNILYVRAHEYLKQR